MEIRRNAKNLYIEQDRTFLTYSTVNECPICKTSTDPIHLYASINSQTECAVFCACTRCSSSFVSYYRCKESSLKQYKAYSLISSEPCKFTPAEFDENIQSLSPNFCEIYNQALSAETSGLDQIAGMGYRKSVEFLIKDYAIYNNADRSEKIASMPLTQCIETFISDEPIKMLAKASTWLGNDEAHYIKKHTEYSISDMQIFIQSLIGFITGNLYAQKATSLISSASKSQT